MKSIIVVAAASVATMCLLATAPISQASPKIDNPAQTDLSPMASECSPRALKKYCAFKSKCTAEEKPGAWICKKGGKFVARISKKAKFAIKSCRATRAKIRYGGARAFYSTGCDHIQMPPVEAFRDEESFYSTLGHETILWSGSSDRLDMS